MDIQATMWALQQLRPGTSWNIRGEVIEQAEDNTPRVAVPTLDEIKVAASSYTAPLTIADRLTALEANVSAVALKTGTVLANVSMQ